MCLQHVAQGALQNSRAVEDNSRSGPGATRAVSVSAAVWPTCDDVLYRAVLALVHGPVVFGLSLA